MIDPKLLQSFREDIEWMRATQKRTNSESSASHSSEQANFASGRGFNFKELLALLEKTSADAFNEGNPKHVAKGNQNCQEHETTVNPNNASETEEMTALFIPNCGFRSSVNGEAMVTCYQRVRLPRIDLSQHLERTEIQSDLLHSMPPSLHSIPASDDTDTCNQKVASRYKTGTSARKFLKKLGFPGFQELWRRAFDVNRTQQGMNDGCCCANPVRFMSLSPTIPLSESSVVADGVNGWKPAVKTK